MLSDLRQPPPEFRERGRRTVRASRAAALLRGRAARGLLIAATAAGFMAWAGAFGTAASPPGLRFAYWLGTLVGGTVVGISVHDLVCARGWFADRPWRQGAATAVLMAVPYTLVVWLLGLMLTPPPFGDGILDVFGPVLAISGLMTALNLMMSGRLVETHAAPPGGGPARFLERLPPRLRGGDLYAVEAHDHYLRLHTSLGTDLILMRLGDAVSELEGIEGARTHRSWWVAKSAVLEARRADGRAVLVLKSGAAAPVSRSFAQRLRAEGWF
jgi:hypothetical protein